MKNKGISIESINLDIQRVVQEINKKEPFLNLQDQERAIRKAHAQIKVQSLQEVNANFNVRSLKP